MDQGKYITEYSNRLLTLLTEKIKPGPQTFGFEYEFLPSLPLNLDIMNKIYRFLPEKGFNRNGAAFIHESGTYIDFEPGGQIEFHTQPLLASDNDKIIKCINLIRATLKTIENELDIEYLAQGYTPGRKDAPLCLDSERYINLHKRLSLCGTRGLEMMKGTASIHFHAGINRIEDLRALLFSMIRLSEMDEFRMGPDRRDIWNNTDSSRCGQPFKVKHDMTPYEVIEMIVEHAVTAYHIGKNCPFLKSDDLSFDAFMYHLTTIFTDIRLNIKGPSFEIRTLDSMPIDQFETKWQRFISVFQEYFHQYIGETL